MSIETNTQLCPARLEVKKRSGKLVDFNSSRIARAVEKAFRADMDLPEDRPLDAYTASEVNEITENVVLRLLEQHQDRTFIGIEEIQDVVEVVLMQNGYYSVAKRYILYRDQQAKLRNEPEKNA